MGQLDPLIHHRRSIRLKGYDYSQPGFYFITICVQGKECLFGHIRHGKMILNEAGRMVEKWYWELENKFSDKKCHHMVVMPNHFHCIIQSIPVGADLGICPTPEQHFPVQHGGLDEQVGSPVHGLGDVVQWFKTMSTNEYIREVKIKSWPRFDGKLWQRNYYEHIIRNENSFQKISSYIVNNPMKWNEDKFYL